MPVQCALKAFVYDKVPLILHISFLLLLKSLAVSLETLALKQCDLLDHHKVQYQLSKINDSY